MIRRCVAHSVVAAVTAVAATSVVGGDSVAAECRTSEFTGLTTCRLDAPRAPNRTVAIGNPRSAAFVWISYFWYNAGGNPFELYDNSECRRTEVVGDTTTYTYGNYYVTFLRNIATGAPVYEPDAVCVFDGDDPALQPPPPPPTEAEFVEAARAVLTVDTSLNPRVEIGGLTGLDTWLWCDDPGEVEVGVALRGWTATATMVAVQHQWSIGGTASASSTSDSCGSEASPAGTWMPETMGPYSVTLTSTWAGTWTLAYNGLPAGTFPLGPFDFAAPTVPYPVSEYRGVLTPPEGEQS